jgi:hypothetical protein
MYAIAHVVLGTILPWTSDVDNLMAKLDYEYASMYEDTDDEVESTS